ncbi:MAG TPA: hypothetical protein PLX06_00660 [Fimbriimonadaceae bacterium]|nr:hypothetical protein [Fimbriimonadaceae bacterium]
MSEKHKESMVGCALFGGLVIAAIGLVVTLMIYMGGALAYMRRGDANLWAVRGLGPGMVLGGLLLSGGALLYGIKEGRRVTSGKGATVDLNARVIAKYAYDREGLMVTEDYLFDERDGLKFYVKIELSGGAVREFQCLRPVHASCGEGMRGAATFDGRWLGSFVPQVGTGAGVQSWSP